MNFKKALFLGLLTACTLIVGPILSSAQSATKISPFKFELSADPGNQRIDSIKIYNQSGRDQEYVLTAENFSANDEYGKPAFTAPNTTDLTFSLAEWITFSEDQITVPAGESKEISFFIDIPANAEPGGHYGSIFFTPPTPESGTVAIQGRIGALILLNVNGDVVKDVRLDAFGTYPEDVDFATGENMNTGWLYETVNVPFAVRLQNMGTVHARPEGKIELYDWSGKKLNNIGIEREINNDGVLMSYKRVDYIPVNVEQGVILPNSYRTYRDLTWDGFVYDFMNRDTGKVELVKDTPWNVMGPFKAVLTLEVNGETFVEEVSFWILPWKNILLTIVILVAILWLLIVWRKRSRKQMIEKLKKELKDQQ